MLRNTPDTQMGQAVMVLCHLALTQAQLTQLPKAVFKVLLPVACGRHVNIVHKMHRAVLFRKGCKFMLTFAVCTL